MSRSGLRTAYVQPSPEDLSLERRATACRESDATDDDDVARTMHQSSDAPGVPHLRSSGGLPLTYLRDPSRAIGSDTGDRDPLTR